MKQEDNKQLQNKETKVKPVPFTPLGILNIENKNDLPNFLEKSLKSAALLSEAVSNCLKDYHELYEQSREKLIKDWRSHCGIITYSSESPLVYIVLTDEHAYIPKKETPGAAAYDLKIGRDVTIVPGRQIIPLDFKIELPQGYEAKIEARSGYSSKGMEGFCGDKEDKKRYDADVMTGKIDADYRGIVGVIIKSNELRSFTIPAGTRIAQMSIYKVETVSFIQTSTLSKTERGEGGFGHTNEIDNGKA